MTIKIFKDYWRLTECVWQQHDHLPSWNSTQEWPAQLEGETLFEIVTKWEGKSTNSYTVHQYSPRALAYQPDGNITNSARYYNILYWDDTTKRMTSITRYFEAYMELSSRNPFRRFSWRGYPPYTRWDLFFNYIDCNFTAVCRLPHAEKNCWSTAECWLFFQALSKQTCVVSALHLFKQGGGIRRALPAVFSF
jgi:hypothetical protein